MNIAILGSAFNPIHRGHVLIAQNARRELKLDKVLFVPCARPPHKPALEMVSDEDRLNMIRMAIEGEPCFEVSTVEMARGGVSYSIDTVREIIKSNPGSNISFIIGSDNFETIGQWYQFPELIALCEFLVIERPGKPLVIPPPTVPPGLLPSFRYRIFHGPTEEISSSQVRTLLRDGKNVSHLLPSSVYEYVLKKNLYRSA